MITSVHIRDTKNIGDLSCSPLQYFDFGYDVRYADLMSDGSNMIDSDVIIYGGGAIAQAATRSAAKQKAKVIGWGLGIANALCDYNVFDMFGGRDFGFNHRWVPCPSCMSPVFDNAKDASIDIVYYGHAKMYQLGDVDNETFNTIGDTVAYLAQGRTIVTSSYHGAYWGLLLGRRVILIDLGRAKFRNMKHKPVCISSDSGDAVMLRMSAMRDYQGELPIHGVSYDNALIDCRSSNIQFYNEVKRAIG